MTTCSERLKLDTKQIHKDTEVLLVNELKTIRSASDYATILKIFYGFWLPVQFAIHNHIDETILDDIHERMNTDKIFHDLKLLGHEGDIAMSKSVPHIDNHLKAFGALYVAEGATLGGRIIARMLRQNDTLTEFNNAFSYFEGYEANTEMMWEKFRAHLNKSFQRAREQVEVVRGAHETFSKMGEWFRLTKDGKNTDQLSAADNQSHRA